VINAATANRHAFSLRRDRLTRARHSRRAQTSRAGADRIVASRQPVLVDAPRLVAAACMPEFRLRMRVNIAG